MMDSKNGVGINRRGWWGVHENGVGINRRERILIGNGRIWGKQSHTPQLGTPSKN